MANRAGGGGKDRSNDRSAATILVVLTAPIASESFGGCSFDWDQIDCVLSSGLVWPGLSAAAAVAYHER